MDLDTDIIDCAKVVPFKGTPLNEGEILSDDSTFWGFNRSSLVSKYQNKLFIKFYSRPRKVLSVMRKLGPIAFLNCANTVISSKFFVKR
jgi:hypothetical protein